MTTFHADVRRRRRLAVVGSGPRGIGILAALLDRSEALGRGVAGFRIIIIDPFVGGGGSVWRPVQAPELLTNSTAAQISMFEMNQLNEWKLDFISWCRSPLAAAETVELAEEANNLVPGGFPSRRLVGAYLRYCYKAVLTRLSGIHDVLEVEGTVRSLHLQGGSVLLDLGAAGEQLVDTAVLALGNPALGGGVPEKAGRRSALGSVHPAPAQAADLSTSHIAPGDRVLVSGLGLTFLDVVAVLTEGRGGRFRETACGKWRYEPSGREPLILAASRRGTPPFPKPVIPTNAPEAPRLRHVNVGRAAALLDGDTMSSEGAAKRVMNLIESELLAHGLGGFPIHEVAGPLQCPPEMGERVHDVVVRSMSKFSGLNQSAALHQVLTAAIDVLAAPALCPRPEEQANAAVVLKVLAENSARFTSGPPAFRMNQLQALAAQGIVTFVGSEAVSEFDGTQWVLRTKQQPTGVPGNHVIVARVPAPNASHLPIVLGGLSWPLNDDGKVCVDPTDFTVKWEVDPPRPSGRVVLAGAMAATGALGSLPRHGADHGFFQQNRNIVSDLVHLRDQHRAK